MGVYHTLVAYEILQQVLCSLVVCLSAYRLDAMPRWWKWYSYINPLRCVCWCVDAHMPCVCSCEMPAHGSPGPWVSYASTRDACVHVRDSAFCTSAGPALPAQHSTAYVSGGLHVVGRGQEEECTHEARGVCVGCQIWPALDVCLLVCLCLLCASGTPGRR